MKQTIFSIVIFSITTITGIAGNKLELRWNTLDSGLAKAKKSDKKLMVDFYTTWCGWCKRLDRDVYGNEQIARYLNQQYILVKINAESGAKVTYKDTTYSETEFARAFGVTGYPTIIFFDSEGKPITSLGGYVGPERFLPIVKFIGEDHYRKMTWEEYQQKKEEKDEKGEKKKD